MRTLSTRLAPLALVASLALWTAGCGDSDTAEPTFAILPAFPAELAEVLDRATVEETRTVDGKIFRLGRIGGTRVVMAMTGIGLVNARDTTRTLLDNFDVAGVVVSGVAGSPHLVGDVTVPAIWELDDDGSTYAVHQPWLEIVREMVRGGDVFLESCAIVPDTIPIPGVAPGSEGCFPYEPRVDVGGLGNSSYPFGVGSFACMPGSHDVFACDSEGYPTVSFGPSTQATLVEVDVTTQSAYDQESAAVAREVVGRGLPFIAFRASSDGGPDPFDLEDFVEFFAYYRLAANNAAAAAAAFVARAG